MNQITYADGIHGVEIGDHVSTRLWFRLFLKTTGRVVYIPGVTPKSPQMEHHGLRWVGVKTASGSVYGAVVDPITHRLQRSIIFEKRDSGSVDTLKPDQLPDDW